MGFQIPGPTKGKVQYLVDMYQAVVLDRPPSDLTISRMIKQLFV
jgi:hypothetical protein